MIPTFASPLFLWGLAAVGGLVAVYFLHMRSKRQIVSSLMLWIEEEKTSDGGRILKRIKTPLAFFLELLALVLLALAAANPMFPRGGKAPVFVILDDSYSMQTEDNAPKSESRKNLEKLIAGGGYRVQVILAGRQPRLLAVRFEDVGSLKKLDERWTCLSPTANLESAIGLTRQLDPASHVLVLSDKKPPETISTDGPHLRWVATGQSLSNLAIIGAVRRDDSDGGKVVVEVANYSAKPTSSKLTARTEKSKATHPLKIAANGTARLTIPLDKGAGPLEMSLPSDTLKLDDRVRLQRDSTPGLRVELAINSPQLRGALRRALAATGRCTITDIAPHLRFSDSPVNAKENCWDVLFSQGENTTAVRGPFVLDKKHPLLEGITLGGVIMSHGEGVRMPGTPLVSANNLILMSVRESGPGLPRCFLHFAPKKTTLLDSIDFPALVWNILRWRTDGLPESCHPNVRLGERISLTLAKGRTNCELTDPSGESHSLAIQGNSVTFTCDTPGRYVVSIDETTIPISANVLFRDESNLVECGRGIVSFSFVDHRGRFTGSR